MNFASFLMGITGSLAARVLTSLGIGFVTYTALTTLVGSMVSNVLSNFNSMGSFSLNIVNLAGGGQFLSVVTAALITRVSLIAIKKLAVIS